MNSQQATVLLPGAATPRQGLRHALRTEASKLTRAAVQQHHIPCPALALNL